MKLILLSILSFLLSISCYAQYDNNIKVEKVLQMDTTSVGQKIAYPQFPDNEVTILKITIPPGASTGWHKHTIPVFAYVLKGTLTVEFANGKSIIFDAGKSIAESINVDHIGRNNTTENVELIAIYLGEKGKQLSVPTKSE